MSLLIRPAEAGDIETILHMGSSAKSIGSRRALIQNAVSQGECWATVYNEVLAGFGVMSYVFFERGFVSLVYVDSAHRRRGVATRLFDEFERQCRSNRIFTSVNLSNLPMQSFLVSRGYVLSGVVQDLDDGDPEMFYSKSLH